jgi:hypothetical protein
MVQNVVKIIGINQVYITEEFDKHHEFLTALCGHALLCNGHIAEMRIKLVFFPPSTKL